MADEREVDSGEGVLTGQLTERFEFDRAFRTAFLEKLAMCYHHSLRSMLTSNPTYCELALPVSKGMDVELRKVLSQRSGEAFWL